MVEQMRRQTEDLIRYYGEIDRRVANTGIEGITGLLEASQEMVTALSVVASQELDWMVTGLRSLHDRLERMNSPLERLRALKMMLADDAESGDPPKRSPVR
jgi:hypothetical protein